MKHFVIYLPGLGDNADAWRRFALKFWRLSGVHAQFIPMKWYDGKGFEEKISRVMTAIDEAERKGYVVSLVGESAGGSMALNAAARCSSLHHVVTICGVDSPGVKLSKDTLRRSPALGVSVRNLEMSLETVDLSRVYTIRGVGDRTVLSRYSTIKGAYNFTVPMIGHRPTIILCLTLLKGYVVSLIRRTA